MRKGIQCGCARTEGNQYVNGLAVIHTCIDACFSLCTHLWFMDLSPPLAQPPLSHHNHHHPPLSPPTLSQPPQLTKASFSHLPLSVPTTHITHSGNIWALPCLALACCSSWTSNMRQEKQLFSKQWASVSPIGIMWFFSDRFVIVRGYRLGHLVG